MQAVVAVWAVVVLAVVMLPPVVVVVVSGLGQLLEDSWDTCLETEGEDWYI